MDDVGERTNWIGVDVGGTNVRAGVLDVQGCLSGWVSYPHRMTSGEFRCIAEAACKALSMADLTWRNVIGMGVAIAGVVDSSAGVVLRSGNLGWQELPLEAELHGRLGVPVVILNDVSASAVAELAALPGGSVSPWLYVSVGTGVAACVILDPVEERLGCVLDIGDTPAPVESWHCQRGEYGGLESVASGSAIMRAARTRIAADPSHSLNARVATITGNDLVDAASQGDPVSLEVLAKAGRVCGRAIASLVNIFTPAGVGLGGGVMAPGSPYVAALIDEAQSAMIPWKRDRAPFHCARLGEQAGVIGASELTKRRLAGPPA